MRTTIDIDDRLMDDAMRATGSRTKRETVERALREVIERAAIRELVDLGGTLPEARAPRRSRW